jgi:glycosyltransferase involved in cell wall biosynthesis
MSIVSLITATHYRPELLERCILAAQKSTLTDYEHIIVADNCPLAEEVYNKYSEDKRIIFARTDPHCIINVGAIAKNKGIEISNSELICYCDDDNIILPNHLEVLSNTINNGYDVAYSCGIHIISSDEESILSRSISEDFSKSIPSDFNTRQIDNTSFSESIGNNYSIFNHDMLNIIHKKSVVTDVGGWYPMADVGYNEDGNLMKRIREIPDIKINYLTDITCVYYARTNKKNKHK